MNKTVISLIAFAILAVAQLAIPGSMLFRSESTLSSGELYKIRTRPVDPYDIFRGRYVALSIEGFGYHDIPEKQRSMLVEGSTFYAKLALDSEGFAHIKSITLKPPKGDYLTMKYNLDGIVVNPFDRFYLQQDTAPEIERLFNEAGWDAQKNSYLTVKIKRGTGVIDNLYIDGTPVDEIVEYLNQLSDKSEDGELKPPEE